MSRGSRFVLCRCRAGGNRWGFESELLAHFFADAAKVLGVEQNFERIDFLANHGKVLGDTRCAGFLRRFFMSGDFNLESAVGKRMMGASGVR